MENNADMPHHMYVESKHYDIMYVKLLHVKLLPRPQCKFPHVKKQRVKSNSRDIIISSWELFQQVDIPGVQKETVWLLGPRDARAPSYCFWTHVHRDVQTITCEADV